MEKIDKAIEILQAFREGKIIEYAEEFEQWEVIESYREVVSALDRDLNIRIKEQPTYRPYANAEEFLNDSVKHTGWLKSKGDDRTFYYEHPVSMNKTMVCFETHQQSLKDILKLYTWADDNTPCGILEQ